MTKYTWDFKHKIYYNIYSKYIAKPGQAVYFTFSRSVFSILSNVRSSRLKVFCRKVVLRNFAKLTQKSLCQNLFFSEVTGLRPAALLKRLWHRSFPVNFVKFLRAPFFTEHLRWLLLKRLSKGFVSLEVTVFTKNSILDV